MRKLDRHFADSEFSLVVSLYNSFGYFGSRSDDVKMLKAVYRVLKPGGIFVVNTLNRDGVTKRLASPISMGREPLPKVFVIDTARYDKGKRETLATWTIIDTRSAKARVTRKSFRQNVYSHSELKQMLRTAGFRIDSVWGTPQGRRFNARKSWHQTIAARKAA
jgi:SAM-dependent methyltransferase